MSPEFLVERLDGDGAVVLSLGGELDVNGAARLLLAAEPVRAGQRLVLDFTEVTFMDSSGLRALMHLDLRARAEEWSLAVAHTQPTVRRVIEWVGLDERLTLVD